VVRGLFRKTVPVGIEHGTVGVLTRGGTLLEVTTFRRDVETFGRKAVVEFAETVEEDLSRRDFTLNAIAWHPLTGRVLDPFGGEKDLRKGVIRTVGDPRERFSEDYLRVLRGLRFSGRFRFLIEGATWDALVASTQHLGILSPERVREELMKVVSDDPRPSGTLSLYGASGVLQALYPEVAAAGGCRRRNRDEDLWTHTLLLMDALPRRRPTLRLAAFFHSVGAPESAPDEEGRVPSEVDPPAGGRERVAAIMFRLRFSNAEIRTVTELIQAGLEAPIWLQDSSGVRRWLHRADPDHLPSLARLWVARERLDHRRWGVEYGPLVDLLRRLRAEVRSGAPLRSTDLALDGRDLISLGLKPGPRFGEILGGLMELVLDEPQLNRTDLLREVVAGWLAEGNGEGR
jgi:poly(A) polymerase/tRNA nucleotidyltransferase (CCA-adding enzyme)